MIGYDAYRYYLGIKAHFTTKSYNIFENRARFKNLHPEEFEGSSRSKFFNGIAKRYTSKDFIQVLVACSAYGSTDDIYDSVVSFEHYQKWLKNKQKMTQLILDDLYKNNEILSTLSGDQPKIIRDVIAGRLNIETAYAVNKFLPFITDDVMKKKNLIYAEKAIKIIKLDKFVKYDEIKIQTELNNMRSVETVL